MYILRHDSVRRHGVCQLLELLVKSPGLQQAQMQVGRMVIGKVIFQLLRKVQINHSSILPGFTCKSQR